MCDDEVFYYNVVHNVVHHSSLIIHHSPLTIHETLAECSASEQRSNESNQWRSKHTNKKKVSLKRMAGFSGDF